MRSSIVRRVGVAIAGLCFLWLVSMPAAAQIDKKEVLRKARDSYYSLSTHGFNGFECGISPNWDALLADVKKTDPDSANKAIAKLSQLTFTVSRDASGKTKVTHTTVDPTNQEMAKGLNQVYSGMEQMVSGFFDTWTPFMIASPFPEIDSEYNLADLGDHWLLSYNEGDTKVETSMGKDLVIRELKVNAPQFSSSFRPQFTPSPQGFLLAGYKADYAGQTAAEATKLDVLIAYQMVNGFELPQKLNLSGSYGGSAFQVEVTFTGCKATGK